MKRIITISSESGSGGHTIGKLVASRKNIPYYDRELIDETARVSGVPDGSLNRHYENGITL